MCGRYTNTGDSHTVATGFQQFDLRTKDIDGFRRYNIAPTQQVAAITAPEGAPQLEMLRWWLVPPWQKELTSKYPMFNAKLETIEKLASFKNLIPKGTRRCLILADGWIEWTKTPETVRQPWWFTVDEHTPFAFAGLWCPAKIDGQELRSCTIITRDSSPNRVASQIHKRMPVVLADPAEQLAWLNLDLGAEVLDMCQALPTARLSVQAANPAINSTRGVTEGPYLLEPDAPPQQELAV